jgi:hypothetical protein
MIELAKTASQLAKHQPRAAPPAEETRRTEEKKNLINPRGNRYLVSVSQSPSPHVSLNLSHDRRELRFDRSWGNTEIGKGECRITHDIIPSHEYHLIACKGWVGQEPEEGRLDLPDKERHRNENPPSLQVHDHQLDELPVAVHPRRSSWTIQTPFICWASAKRAVSVDRRYSGWATAPRVFAMLSRTWPRISPAGNVSL